MAKKSKKRIWIAVGIIATLLIAAVVLIVIKSSDQKTKVQVEKIGRRTITQTVSAIGKIQPETEVKISPEASGEIVTLNVKEGDFVQKNQLLVRIKPDLFETQLDQFRASVKSASVAIEMAKVEVERSELEMKRVGELYKKEFASKQEWETAKAGYDRAQAQYQQMITDKTRAEAALRQVEVSASRTTIYAPMAGTVTKLLVENGEKVVGTAQMQGTEMMRVSDLNVMNAIVDVDENDVVKVKLGDTAKVKIDAFPDKTFRGYVYEISHSPKQQSIGTQDEVINFEVKIRLIDKEIELRPGMSCSVDIQTETHPDVVSVPLQSVTIRAADDKKEMEGNGREIKTEKVGDDKKQEERPPQVVFVYDAGKVKQVKVETGISDKGYIEVKSGVNEGQTIVSGSFNTIAKVLNDGMKVQIDSTSNKKKKPN
ncbi:MAG: efflux RND transporter periplasmic adaptor subunit [Bacteriodetes bacterium]|nr:efflux RND transporter periplasmic adaptor subunit [Bacteroidota bacterium]